jgi:hypothetical protein
MNTPILFIVFNRPDLTERCLEKILLSKPSKIFISSDGPRNNEDNVKIKAVRSIIKDKTNKINCEYIYHEKNLGCKKAVSYAINYFFSKVERGIVLEDDCIPKPEFFEFCNKMLDIYNDNTNIVHISGSNPQMFIPNNSCNYFFSRYPRIWGWAGWSRSTKDFDVDLKSIHKNIFLKLKSLDYFQIKLILYLIYLVKVKKIDTWDYQWCISSMINGLSIVPNQSLVENVGFGEEASHTKDNTKYKFNSQLTPFILESKLPNEECLDLNLEYKYINDIFGKFYRYQQWI